MTQRQIAKHISRDPSIVSREIKRHSGASEYRAHRADLGARNARARPKRRKIDSNPELKQRVVSDLRKSWSPEQIAGRARWDGGVGEEASTIATGVAARLIPTDIDARAAMWRDRMADKRVLLILDDATGHRQVEPLLPGAAGCLVLVTS